MPGVSARASAIRHYLRDHPDQPLVRKYSFVAARLEQTRLAQVDGDTTPGEDGSFRELAEMLRALTHQLGLGDAVTG